MQLDNAPLEKAELYSLDGDNYTFKFMFNPTELDIRRQANVNENQGARTKDKGIPKVSFAHPKATIITIKNIILDAYERSDRRNIDEEIGKLTSTVKFVQGKDRPPIYIFGWGKANYLRCYVESVNYQLTLFLANGTPVRAKASMTLKEVDPTFGDTNPPAAQRRREIDTRW